jgi:hypothetical protein
MATNEEVEEQRDRVHELRARVEEAKNGSSATQQELANDITLTQLQAEEAALEAQLAEIEHRNDPAVMKRAAVPLVSAQEQMAAAVAQQKAVASNITAEKKAAAPAAPAVPATEKVAADKTPKVEG